MTFRTSWSWCFHLLTAHLWKAPGVSIITLLSLQSKGNSFSPADLQKWVWEKRWGGPTLWSSWEGIRSCRDLDRALGTGTSISHGCGKELPPRSGCSSGHFQCCRELSWLIKGCWVN